MIVSDAFRSISAYLESLPAIRKYGILKYIIGSSIISLLLGLGVIWGSKILGAYFSTYIVDYWDWDFGRNIIGKVSSWISSGIVLFIFWFIFKYIVFIVLSPLLSFISEDIESQYDGTDPIPFTYKKMMHDVFRGFRLALRNLSRELFYTIVLLLLGLIPVFTIFSAIGVFLIQAYYAGFGNMDFYLERRFSVGESVRFIRKRKLAAIGNGSVFLLLLTVPILGIMVAPFLGAISATLFLLKESDI